MQRLNILIVMLSGILLPRCKSVETEDESKLRFESRTAVVRTMMFSGRVFVSAKATDEEISAAVLAQTKSLFGLLSHIPASVATPTLQKIDASTLKKSLVEADSRNKWA